MFHQPQAVLAESQSLYGLLKDLGEEDLARPTLFKSWTANRILGHLHVWNIGADLSLSQPEAFASFNSDAIAHVSKGDLARFEKNYLKGLSGHALLEEWMLYTTGMCDRFAQADPKARVPWVGPDMSVRSSISARLMETWSHAQALYDLFGVDRQDQDYIKNIAILGVNTFGWTFKNRKMDIPEVMPYLCLTAPSGEVWEWGEPNKTERIEGRATDFCQVITQTRNIADTELAVTGPVATEWMAMAQCFAGPPETPPAKGQRYKA